MSGRDTGVQLGPPVWHAEGTRTRCRRDPCDGEAGRSLRLRGDALPANSEAMVSGDPMTNAAAPGGSHALGPRATARTWKRPRFPP